MPIWNQITSFQAKSCMSSNACSELGQSYLVIHHHQISLVVVCNQKDNFVSNCSLSSN